MSASVRHVVVGTAGHIDHGKTSLVKSLTGIDCDRLPEEQQRGITIDLGFAFLTPRPGLSFGIVDVPGHERFVKNMVAGTGGMDLVVLVVAADEGVMPQTREHLDICQLLGLERGLIVLTKVDLVEPDWLALVREDVAEVLSETFLADAPILTFSAVDERGKDEIEQTLVELAQTIPPRREGGAPRMPVDRVFTLSGFGTVLTGTLLAGRVRTGDELEAIPSGVRAKVRGLQAYGGEIAEASAGMRTAINLQGVARTAIQRGEVITAPGALEGTTRLDVDLTYLPHAKRPLRARSRALFHLGTATAMGSLFPLEGEALAPGETGVVQVRLDRPVAAMPGDRFILRGFEALEHHGRTVGGGVVLDAHAPRHRRRDRSVLPDLAALRDGSPGDRIDVLVRRSGRTGLTAADIGRRLPLSAKEITRCLGELLAAGRLVRFDKERQGCVHSDTMAVLVEELRTIIEAFHRDHPDRAGVPKEELRTRLRVDPKLLHLLLGKLEEEIETSRDVVRKRAHLQALPAAEGEIEEEVRRAYRESGLTPPRTKELAQRIGVDEPQIMRVVQFLSSRDEITRVTADLYFDHEALQELERRLVDHLQQAGEITTQEFKEMTGLTRKYLIGLQEYFDAKRLTLRVGDKRVLRGG